MLPATQCLGQATESPAGTCRVELAAYDASGNRVPAKIVSVVPVGGAIDLRSAPSPEERAVVREGSMYFPSRWLRGRRIEVTLKDETGTSIRQRVALSSCEQRTSIEFGAHDTGLDVSVSSLVGKFKGCKFEGDWWVRAVPMFGS